MNPKTAVKESIACPDVSFVIAPGVDAPPVPVQPNFWQTMKKTAAKPKEKKTSGAAAVEKYRPRMNKLTDAERERLLARAMVTIYGQPANADRR